MPARLQIQLVSLCNLCSSKAVLDRLRRIRSPKKLPVREDQAAPQLHRDLEDFLGSFDENPFSIRFQSLRHNSWIHGGAARERVLSEAIRGTFTREDVEWYTEGRGRGE